MNHALGSKRGNRPPEGGINGGQQMKNVKKDKKTGTIRPWLVDVAVE